MAGDERRKFVGLSVGQVQILSGIGIIVHMMFFQPQVLKALPLAFLHNLLEFLWNAVLVVLCFRACLLVWVRPLYRFIFADTNKVGHKLEWYDANLKHLTPLTRPLALKRWFLVLGIACALQYAIRLHFVPLVSVDRETRLIVTYFSRYSFLKTFAISTLFFWLCLMLEGRSRIIARIMHRGAIKAKEREYLTSVPLHPFDPKSAEFAVSLFTTMNAAGMEEWWPMGEKSLRGSMMFFSPIGGGKTQGLILPFIEQAIAWQYDNPTKKASIIVYDPKAELTPYVVSIAKATGRESDLLVLSFINGDKCINPIAVKDPWDESSAFKVAGWIITAWQNFQGRKNPEPYWENQSYQLIKNLMVLLYMEKGRAVTIYDLYKFYQPASTGVVSETSKEVTDFGLRVFSHVYAVDPKLETLRQFAHHTFPPLKTAKTEELLKAKEDILAFEKEVFATEKKRQHVASDRECEKIIAQLRFEDDDTIISMLNMQLKERIDLLLTKDLESFKENHVRAENLAHIKLTGDALRASFDKSYGNDPKAKDYLTMLAQAVGWLVTSWAASDNKNSVVSNVEPFLENFSVPTMVRLLSPEQPTVDFSDYVNSGSIIVPNFPGITIGERLADAIITLIKSSWQNAVLESKTERIRIQVIDEAQRVINLSSTGHGGDLEYAELSRSFGGVTVMVSQSVSALEVKASSAAAFEKINGVIRTIGCFGTNDFKTIQFMQHIAGKEVVERKSRTITENKNAPQLDTITEEYGGGHSSLSLSYTLSEALEERVKANDINEADLFSAVAVVFDGYKNKITKIFFRPYFWPDRRDSFELIKRAQFDPKKRQKIKRAIKKDPIKALYREGEA